MKKFIAALILFATIGCAPPPKPSTPTNSDGVEFVQDGVKHFAYREHVYIRFAIYKGGGVVHDPDCPCYEVKALK